MDDGLAELGALALGSRLKRLADCLMQQGSQVYQIAEAGIEPRWFPVYSFLHRHGPTTITGLAQGLGVSHPAINKIANELIEVRLAAPYRDRNDKRKRVLALTTLGREKYRALEPVLFEMRRALQSLVDDAGGNILESLTALERSLSEASVVDRFMGDERALDAIEFLIRPYQYAYQNAFRSMNESWIGRHFDVSAIDLQHLENPEVHIIDPGGDVLFAVDGASDRVLGTVALLRRNDDVVELAYLALVDQIDGDAIAQGLGEAALRRSRELGAVAVCTFTSRLLESSLRCFRRLGFEERRFKGDVEDQRREVYMEVEL